MGVGWGGERGVYEGSGREGKGREGKVGLRVRGDG